MAELGREPPVASASVRDEEVAAVEGSAVWDGLAIDRLATVPDDALTVRAGEEVRFHEAGPPAEDVTATVYTAASISDLTLEAITVVTLEPDAPVLRVDLPVGDYVVAFSRTWDDDHSTVGYVRLVVVEPGG